MRQIVMMKIKIKIRIKDKEDGEEGKMHHKMIIHNMII